MAPFPSTRPRDIDISRGTTAARSADDVAAPTPELFPALAAASFSGARLGLFGELVFPALGLAIFSSRALGNCWRAYFQRWPLVVFAALAWPIRRVQTCCSLMRVCVARRSYFQLQLSSYSLPRPGHYFQRLPRCPK